MAVAGPLSAVGAAALPALVGALLGERLAAASIVGVLVALPAIWLVSGAGTSSNGPRRGAVDGLVSGAGFSLEFVALERAGTGSGLWPVAVSQTTALLLLAALVFVLRPALRASRTSVGLALAAGVLALTATSLYFVAANAGLLTVAAVLASLYPAVTVCSRPRSCASDRTVRQLFGLAMAAVAVILIVVP